MGLTAKKGRKSLTKTPKSGGIEGPVRLEPMEEGYQASLILLPACLRRHREWVTDIP
jgi:hypothetical protein